MAKEFTDGPLAQLVEQGTLNPKVIGSNPIRPTIKEIERKKTAGEVLMPNIDESVLDGRDPPSATPANRIGF